nr:importin-5-like [Ipomoea trifida]
MVNKDCATTLRCKQWKLIRSYYSNVHLLPCMDEVRRRTSPPVNWKPVHELVSSSPANWRVPVRRRTSELEPVRRTGSQNQFQSAGLVPRTSPPANWRVPVRRRTGNQFQFELVGFQFEQTRSGFRTDAETRSGVGWSLPMFRGGLSSLKTAELLDEEVQDEYNIYRQVHICLGTLAERLKASFLPFLDELLPFVDHLWKNKKARKERRFCLSVFHDIVETTNPAQEEPQD